MSNFYIKKLIVTGSDKDPSFIEFDDGLNIITGPSNTGKSYVLECIDYLFGSEKIHFDKTTGYDCIKLMVTSENGNITLERQIDTNRISVHSDNRKIRSGYYGISGNNNVSELWLRLIGIEDNHQIIKNSRYEKQRLTWRTFLHMFLVKESVVFQESSILMPKQNTASTAALSALFFLITGIDFADADPREEKKIKEVRKKAVVDYINKRLSDFAVRKSELDKIPIRDALYLHENVEAVLSEIAETEKTIKESVSRSKQLLKEIFVTGEQLAECNTLFNRYQALKTQYSSDIKRLTFIVEGELHKDEIPINSKCPFCSGNIPIQNKATYAEASHAELHRIQLQLDDLLEAEQDLITEHSALEARNTSLSAEKSNVEILMNNELKPKVAELKQILSEYRSAIEIQNETSLIDDFETSMQTELVEAMMEDETETIFKIKNQYDCNIIDMLNECLRKILKACKFDALSSVYFDPNTFDIVVNGKPKNTFGKGYRAFLNSVLATALMEYLAEHGKYSPRTMFIDSPILSLKERGDESASETMKSALFQYLLDNQDYGQIIIVENDIPKLNYGKANVIRFSKDETQGRYGFLNDVR